MFFSSKRKYLSIPYRLLHRFFSEYLILSCYSAFSPWFVLLIITINFFLRMSLRKKKSPWRVAIRTKCVSTITIIKWVDSRHVFIILHMHILMKIVLSFSLYFYCSHFSTTITVVHHLLFLSLCEVLRRFFFFSFMMCAATLQLRVTSMFPVANA
jgi:hypothetical protein